MTQSIKVKIVKETRSRVTIYVLVVNRKMHVPKKDFYERVDNGLYEVVNQDMLDQVMESRKK